MTGKICGTGSWVPDKVWDNNDLARMVETSDAWIRERTGVVQRHIAKENEDTVTMAARGSAEGAGRCRYEGGRNRPDYCSNDLSYRDHALCGMWCTGADRSGKLLPALI